jgi:SAM-dependent methyltransferase
MKILNPAIQEAMSESKPLSLDIGCGAFPRRGHFGLDCLDLPGVDIVADLEQPLSELPDNSVGRIYTRHTFEHVKDLVPLLRELRRVLRPDGVLEVIVPHFSNPYYYSDPTHVRFFGLYTFQYFANEEDQPKRRKVPSNYTDIRFKVESVFIEFYRKTPAEKGIHPLFQWIVNLNEVTLDFYERRMCWLMPAWQVKYRLRPVK